MNERIIIMIEELHKIDETPTIAEDKKEFRRLGKFIDELVKHTGIDCFYPCRYEDKRKGEMCVVTATKLDSGISLCMIGYPDYRMKFIVRRDSVPGRQLVASSVFSDSYSCAKQFADVVKSAEDIGAEVGDKLSAEVCGLAWELVPVTARKDDEEEMRMPSGKSDIDPAMEARIKKALAEELAKERGENHREAQPE